MREDREDGRDAVGTGLPGPARDQLTVLPYAEFERLKDRLTWEEWKAKTLDAEEAEAANLRVH